MFVVIVCMEADSSEIIVIDDEELHQSGQMKRPVPKL